MSRTESLRLRLCAAVAFALYAGCWNPAGVELNSLDPAATHFVWFVRTPDGALRDGRLVSRREAAPAILREGEELFVFAVRPEVFTAFAVDLSTLPSQVSVNEAQVCDPVLEPGALYRLEDGVLKPSAEAALALTADIFRACRSPRPDLRFHGPRARECMPSFETVAACEWEVTFEFGCLLPSDEQRWRLRTWAADEACVGPLSDAECTRTEASGRLLSETRCPAARAVLSRPADALDVKVALMPGHPGLSYASARIKPGQNGELGLRSAYVPDLLRLSDDTLVVAASSGISDPVDWRPDVSTTLHHVDANTLEVRSSTPPMPFVTFGLVADGSSADSVLAIMTSTAPDTLRIVRLGLDGVERTTRDLRRHPRNLDEKTFMHYVDGFYAPELDALLVVLALRDRVPAQVDRYWTEVLILDPGTLEVRTRLDTRSLVSVIYPIHASYVPVNGRPGLILVGDYDDTADHVLISPDELLQLLSNVALATGGGAAPQHATQYQDPEGGARLVVSLSSDQRSWRSFRGAEFSIQFSAFTSPTITAPLGLDLLLAPAVDLDTGDLEFLLLEPERADVVSATAPALRGVGPAGREVHDGRGTVWMTLPWTGHIMRISRSAS